MLQVSLYSDSFSASTSSRNTLHVLFFAAHDPLSIFTLIYTPYSDPLTLLAEMLESSYNIGRLLRCTSFDLHPRPHDDTRSLRRSWLTTDFPPGSWTL